MAAAAIARLGAAAQQPLFLPGSTFATLPSQLAASTPAGSPHPTALAAAPADGHPTFAQNEAESISLGKDSLFPGVQSATNAWTTVASIWRSIVTAVTPKYVGPEEEKSELGTIPDYVLEYAPYVHLYSGENFWPCDIADHLVHTTPRVNYTAIEGMEHDRTVDNLDELNRFGWYAYLQSDDNVEERPDWLGGARNIPSTPGKGFGSSSRASKGGYSSAPAVLVVVPKEDGIVDAFWFYFYSYNLGNKVVNVRFGNHVGDWEHTVVRFRHGKPELVFLSEHNFGEAYAFSALEKLGKRPVTFSATGTHAMYATPGSHPYVLPLGLLHDQTDRGPLWDPRQNLYAYTLNPEDRVLRASKHTPDAPVNWFYYRGHWGDRAYPMNDSRQYGIGGQYHYVSGPLGPIYKNLWRKDVCQGRGKCHIRYWLPPADEVKTWPGDDVEDGMRLE